MDSYCQYNDAFYNSDNENLDRLARQVNNDKKKLHKKIKENINRQEQNACIGIDCLLDPANARYGPSNLSDFGFFSTQCRQRFLDFSDIK
jgi:ABC-type transporter lipoprotein component MlaA